ncbi:hypothetical protein QIS99_28710 [Streptomyces sp. B-S-A8]|uniref:Helix-turn-helix domain-containing protein n=1 Tax=Streptomyces solicavernae TaxID=3043614 RepID=A0ABT6S0F6_9ACTN|nr:hypothetical protein [Streptomyces sp. B-S-A8]MDI3390142.1 hypothetical protein [Streptomyces sp. B-S-A8]
MKVYRAKVRPGFIAVDNKAEDADLSCRALGLLVRWLRFPEGAEIPDARELVKQRRRRGCTRIEGRDALYTASYELEAEGFLVRDLVRTENGHHEWVAFVYPYAVPPEERSDPNDRKKPRSGRDPENPEPGPTSTDTESRDPDFQDPGNQDPENQDSSYTNREQTSSSPPSSSTTRASTAEAPTNEEDEKTLDSPASAPAAPEVPAARKPAEQDVEVEQFVAGLPGMDRQGPRSCARLYEPVAAALSAGWAPQDLRAHLEREVRPSEVRKSLAGVYVSVLRDLPSPPSPSRPAPKAVRPDRCERHPDLSTVDGCPLCRIEPPAPRGMGKAVLAALANRA